MVSRIPSSPPEIKKITSGEKRPLWSVMIPVYNCSNYLSDAIMSVLVQAKSAQEMQIEVVDDASTDAIVEELVQRVGKGRVSYFRQSTNVGSLRNFETCINRSKGELIHILHGDDRVRGGFYDQLGNLLHEYPKAGAAFCRYSYISFSGDRLFDQECEMMREGVLENWLLRIAERQSIQYVAMVVRRGVYEELGSFYALTYGEDWVMWVRIARHYSMVYTPQILAEYRKHSFSISGQKFLSGQYLVDARAAISLIQNYLPEEYKKNVLRKSKKFYAMYAIREANQSWIDLRDKNSIKLQILQILKTYRSIGILWLCFKLFLKVLVNKD